MLRWQMEESPSRILSKKKIEELAICGKRFKLVQDMLKHIPNGTRRIADVERVGPANIEKSTMAVAEWDRIVKGREENGQCKGVFLTSFSGKNSFRRCEVLAAAKEDVCELCKRMRGQADAKGAKFVSCAGQPEYEIVTKALFKRPGVMACVAFWKEESERMKAKYNLKREFPFFSANEMVSWLMVEGGVIFKNGGKGGRAYKRSEVIVREQDLYLKECMGQVLTILRFDSKRKFKQRMSQLMVVADKIHEQMMDANEGSEMVEVGAIQKPDIVREELTRTGRIMERTKKGVKMFSVHIRRLAEWAAAREKRKQAENSSAGGSPTESVSSSSPPPMKRNQKELSAKKVPLKLSKVDKSEEEEEGKENARAEQQQKSQQEKGVQAFKKFEIRTSTIPGAGLGLFLKEAAKDGEPIARYSGKLLDEEEAKKSSSKYIIKVARNVYLCAEAEDEWEGKRVNCARKARRKVNARFQANGQISCCKVSRKSYIKIYAVGKIAPEEEVLADYQDEYWPAEEGEENGGLPTPERNGDDEDEDDANDSIWQMSDEENDGKASDDGGKKVVKKLQFTSPEGEEGGDGDKNEGPLRRSSRLKLEKQRRQEEKARKEKEDAKRSLANERNDGTHGYDSRSNGHAVADEGYAEADDRHDDAGKMHDGESNGDHDASNEHAGAAKVPGNAENGRGDEDNAHGGADNGHDNGSSGHGRSDNGHSRAISGRGGANNDHSGGSGRGMSGRNVSRQPRRYGEDGDENQRGRGKNKGPKNTGKKTGRRIYAVVKGRCIGLFRSSVRARSSVERFPRAKSKKFWSEEEAEDFLMRNGVEAPEKYWKYEYPSGTLIREPDSVTGSDVWFPAGNGVGIHGVVLNPTFDHDQWMWRVRMDDGRIDRMSEWPLLVGLEKPDMVDEEDEEDDESSDQKKFVAVRGSDNDGVVRSVTEALPRLKGPHAEWKEFSDEEEAERWISELYECDDEELTFYAVRGGEKDGIVMTLEEACERLVGKGAEWESFQTKKEAKEWIEEMKFFAVKFANGKTRVIQIKDLMRLTRGQRGFEVSKPMSKDHAREQIKQWKEEGEKQIPEVHEVEKCDDEDVVDLTKIAGCIARMKDGSICGRRNRLKETELGPLCGEHAELCKQVHKQKPQSEEQEVSVDSVAEVSSPEDRILIPPGSKSLQKDRKGLFAVVAVRTFRDAQWKGKPAGSVWLSSDEAYKANKKEGEMKIFDTHKEIFENIAEAKSWIEKQGKESERDLEAEAAKRWKQAQEKEKDKLADETSNQPAAAASAGASASNSGRTASNSGRSASKSRRKTSNGRRKKSKSSRKSKKKDDEEESKDEDDDQSSDEEQEEDDTSAGSSGRFRRSRRRKGARGGLRSGAVKMLDKKQKRIEEQLFPNDAKEVCIYEQEVPDMKLVQKIPLPGKAQALTTGKDAGHVLSFANDMKAVLAERTFKSFDAFSLSDLLEFKQVVDYVASYQPEESKRVAESVVEGVTVIVNNAISLHATMRDANELGQYGENFKAYTYLQVMYLIMFREAFEGTWSDMFFWNYAPKFAIKARGCPGMAPWKNPNLATEAPTAKSQDRCLLCGKKGHRADSDVHKQELAEGSRTVSPDQLSAALANIAKDSSLNAEQKRSWSARTRSFWSKLSKEAVQSAEL